MCGWGARSVLPRALSAVAVEPAQKISCPATRNAPTVAAPVQIDWRVLGQHFNRSYETVSYKVSYMKNTQRKAGGGWHYCFVREL